MGPFARNLGLLVALAAGLAMAGCAASASAEEDGAGMRRLRAVVASSPVALPAIRIDIDEDGRVAKVNGFDAAGVDAGPPPVQDECALGLDDCADSANAPATRWW